MVVVLLGDDRPPTYALPRGNGIVVLGGTHDETDAVVRERRIALASWLDVRSPAVTAERRDESRCWELGGAGQSAEVEFFWVSWRTGRCAAARVMWL